MRDEFFDRIGMFPQFLDLVFCAIELGISFEVTEKAQGFCFNRTGPTTVSGPLNRFADGLIHGKKVGAVHFLTRHSKGFRPPDDVVPAQMVVGAGEFAVAVVFVHEDHRKLEHRSQVERLEHSSLVRRPVPNERHGDTPGLERLGGERCADGDRRRGTNNGIGPQHAPVHVHDMHRAAFAITQATLLAENLQQHVSDVTTLGDTVSRGLGAYCPRSLYPQVACMHLLQ